MSRLQLLAVAAGGTILIAAGRFWIRQRRKHVRSSSLIIEREDQALERVFLTCSSEYLIHQHTPATAYTAERRMTFNEFEAAFGLLGVPVDADTLKILFKTFSLCDPLGSGTADDYLNKESFLLAVVQVPSAFREKEKWVSSLNIHKLVATHLPNSHLFDPVGAIKTLKAGKLKEICRRICHDLEALLSAEVSTYSQKAGSGSQVASNQKFAMSCGAIQARYGALEDFFEGLDARIGLPNPNVLKAMEEEHCFGEDAEEEFETSNYGGTKTFPKQEWEFVNNPVPGKKYPGALRSPERLDAFQNHETAIKAKLITVEVIGLRLFTGPMFMKYNASLREFPQEAFEQLKGNRYTTTIHAVVSGIIKLSKVWELPPSRKVFRGMSGMVLPQAFWKKDTFGCRGGVEYGLMSTTTNRDVAVQYTVSKDGKSQLSTIFEIEVGQVDRGASLKWVSQYPGEDEILMPPLSNLEVIGEPTMDGDMMVIRLRINVNIKSLTISQLEARRKQLHLAMMRNLIAEAKRDLMSLGHLRADCDKLLVDFREKMKEVEAVEPAWMNIDKHFREAVNDALNYKTWTVHKGTVLKELDGKRFSIFGQVEKLHVQEFANYSKRGFMYALRSGLAEFPFGKVVKGSVAEVEMPIAATKEQASIVWECLKDNLGAVTTVVIKDAQGKTARLPVNSIVSGKFLDLAPLLELGAPATTLLLQAARHNTRLTHLSLAGTMPESFAEVVLDVLASCPHVLSVGPLAVFRFNSEELTSLSLDYAGLSRVELVILSKLLQSVPSLTSLSLAGNVLYSAQSRQGDECLFCKLCSVLCTLQLLCTLNLAGTRLGGWSNSREATSTFQTSQSTHTEHPIGLRSRSSRSKLLHQNSSFLPSLAYLIETNTNLSSLDLRRNSGGITYNTLQDIVNLFDSKRRSGWLVSGMPLGALSKGLVTSLNLRKANLGPTEAGILGNFIQSNTSLKSIDLAQNRLASVEQLLVSHVEEQGQQSPEKRIYADDFPGFRQLCQSLSHLKNLTFLDISHNYLTRANAYNIEGIADLCTCISSNPLRSLNLAGNAFSIDDVALFANALSDNKQILYLNDLPSKTVENPLSAPSTPSDSLADSCENTPTRSGSTDSRHLHRSDSNMTYQMNQMQAIFDEFDADKSGTLDADELQEFAFALGQNWTSDTCAQLLDLLDVDKTGTISFENFASWYFKTGSKTENSEEGIISNKFRTQLFLRSTLRRPRSFGTSAKPQKNADLMAARVILRWLIRKRRKRSALWIWDLAGKLKEPSYEIFFVAQRLLSYSMITHLNLSRCRLEDEHLKIILRSLIPMEKLRDLDVRDNLLTFNAADAVMSFLSSKGFDIDHISKIPILKLKEASESDLRLSSKDFGPFEAVILSHMLECNPGLGSLSVADNPSIFKSTTPDKGSVLSPQCASDHAVACFMSSLMQLTGLTQLDMSRCKVGQFQHILDNFCRQILPAMTNLRSLHIDNNDINPSCEILFDTLLSCTNLTLLNGLATPDDVRWDLKGRLRECFYEIAFVLRRVQDSTHLTALDLRQNPLVEGWNRQPRFLSEITRLQRLQALEIDTEGLNIEIGQRIWEALPQLHAFCRLPVAKFKSSNVEDLSLPCMDIGSYEGAMLGILLDKNPQQGLTLLDLSANYLTCDKGFSDLQSAILSNKTSPIEAAGTALSSKFTIPQRREDSGFQRLCKSLSLNCHALIRLNLSNNFLGGQHLQELSAVLTANAGLSEIGLSNNCLAFHAPELAWQSFCRSITSCSGLAALEFAGNGLGKLAHKGIQQFEQTLKSSKTLQSVDLAFNSLDGRQLSIVVSALRELKSLQRLCVGGTSIVAWLYTDRQHGSSATNNHGNGLFPNALDSTAANAIVDLIKCNKNLTDLDIRGLKSDGSIHARLGNAVVDVLKTTTHNLQFISTIPVQNLLARSLRDLDLSWRELGTTECIILTYLLEDNTELCRLNLMGNRLRASSVEDGHEGVDFFEDLCDVVRSLAAGEAFDNEYPEVGPVQRSRSGPVATPTPSFLCREQSANYSRTAQKSGGQLTVVDLRANRLPADGLRKDGGLHLLVDERRQPFEMVNSIPCAAIQVRKLCDLQLPDRNLDEADCTLLAKVLSACPYHIVKLNLAGNSRMFRCHAGDTVGLNQEAYISPLWAALGCCTRLQELNLSRNDLVPDQTRAFAEALLLISSLTYLDVSYNPLGQATGSTVGSSQRSKTVFRDLKTLEALFSALTAAAARLRVLDLRSVAICSSGARALARALSACTALERLELCSTHLAPQGITALSPGLRVNGALTALDLSEPVSADYPISYAMSAEGLVVLVEALRHGAGRLRKLALRGHRLNHVAAEVLSPLLSHLTDLDISSNSLGFRGAERVAAALSPGLVSLNLSKNGLLLPCHIAAGSGAALSPEFRAVCRELARLTCLHHLDLSGNNIDDEAVMELVPFLHSNAGSLRTLTIASGAAESVAFAEMSLACPVACGLRSDGARVLSAALSDCCHVETLDLSGNGLGWHGTRIVATGLRVFRDTLTKLDLSGSRLQDRGASALAEGLGERQQFGQLAVLGLAANGIGDTGVCALAGALCKCPALTTLRLGLDATAGSSPSSRPGTDTSGVAADRRDHPWRNTVRCGGATALAGALAGRTALTLLALDQCDVGAGGAWALAGLAAAVSSLTCLPLDGNRIPTAARCHVCSAVAANELHRHRCVPPQLIPSRK